MRNGWFSYRWSQIIESGDLTGNATVMKAQMQGNSTPAPFAPSPIDDVIKAIETHKPQVVFAPHVETSAGVILPDDYIQQMAEAAHAVGALLNAAQTLQLVMAEQMTEERERAINQVASSVTELAEIFKEIQARIAMALPAAWPSPHACGPPSPPRPAHRSYAPRSPPPLRYLPRCS